MKLILFAAVLNSIAFATAQQIVNRPIPENYYTAAVFEHARRGNISTQSPAEIIRENLRYFARATEIAKSKGANIIVFPEYGAFPLLPRSEMKDYLETVPDPEGNWNPCLQESTFQDRYMLRTLSCMARNSEIYIVANIGDIQPCHKKTGCPDDATLHYNANVVFDTEGKIISRYRKEHLFFEPGMDIPEESQHPLFTTDFGRFAHFICFDIIFKHTVEAAEEDNVDGVILPTMWGDMLPGYNAVQYWLSWSIGNNVTLIAANAQHPGSSAVGSGVFTGNLGAVKYTYNPDGQSKLLVTRVPKHRNQFKPFPNPEADITIITSTGTKKYDEDTIDFNNYLPKVCSRNVVGNASNGRTDYRCYNENVSNYTMIKLSQLEDHLEACNNGMCCTLDYSMDQMNDNFYFGVVNGTFNSVNYYHWCTENCILARCDSHHGTSCEVFPTKSSTMFKRLLMQATTSTKYVYPSVIRNGMRLASLDEWVFNKTVTENGTYNVTINFTKNSESQPMLIAALYSRCYDRDPPYSP